MVEDDAIGDAQELIRCGTVKGAPLDEAVDYMMKNKVMGKETITFLTTDWERTSGSLNELITRLHEMSQLTPVKGAHGLCKVTTCQWSELSVLRDKANKDAEKLRRMYTITDDLVQVISQLIAEKLVAAEGWWHRKFAKINCEIEDLKHS